MFSSDWCQDFFFMRNKNQIISFRHVIPPYIKMLDLHWIKAMLFFRKYYDFLQLFLHHGIFPHHFMCRGIFQKYNGRWENTMSKNRSWLKIVVFTFRCSRDFSSGNDNHILGGIIEIYHACKWYLPKNTGFETRQISLAYRLGKFVQSLNQYFLANTTYKHGIFL